MRPSTMRIRWLYAASHLVVAARSSHVSSTTGGSFETSYAQPSRTRERRLSRASLSARTLGANRAAPVAALSTAFWLVRGGEQDQSEQEVDPNGHEGHGTFKENERLLDNRRQLVADDASASEVDPAVPAPADAGHEGDEPTRQRLMSGFQSRSAAITPLFLAALARTRLFPTVYSLALLGSSLGFYLFVYFTSLGYALAIGLPAAWLLTAAAVQHGRVSWHALLVLAWAARLGGFLLHRELRAWPALHQQYQQARRRQHQPDVVVKLQTPGSDGDAEDIDLDALDTDATTAANVSGKQPSLGPPPVIVQILSWLVFSFCYTCLVSPCYYIHTGLTGQQSPDASLQPMALLLQLTGLAIETVADQTKSAFKRYRPADWCNVGIWRYGRHVNYAGEWLFWLGTYLAGLTLGRVNLASFGVMTVGLLFISAVLRGAAEFVSARQLEKYGDGTEYLEFRDTHGMLGPNAQTVARIVKAQVNALLHSRRKAKSETIMNDETSVNS